MRPSWTYKLGENIVSMAKEEKNLGVVIQDNLSAEKHINRIFGDIFMMLRNIRMAYHFLDKDMRKIIITMIRPELEYVEVIWSTYKKKHVLKLERIQRIATKMVQELEGLPQEERLKEMHLITLKERRERGDLIITIYKLMNNLEETDREDLILRRKGEAGNLR